MGGGGAEKRRPSPRRGGRWGRGETAPSEGKVRDFGTRLKAATEFVNAHYNLENLQNELPERLVKLADREGGRIGK